MNIKVLKEFKEFIIDELKIPKLFTFTELNRYNEIKKDLLKK